MPALSPTMIQTTAPVPRLSTIYRALNLVDDPFAHDPRAGAFAATSVHATARTRLLAWIHDASPAAAQDGRLAVVTSEEGCGKTRLLGEITRDIATDPSVHVAVLPDDDDLRTDAQILRGILAALGHAPAGRTGLELMGEIQHALSAIRASGKRPGILIDGADFSGSRLELTRNLLRDAAESGLWVVLFGQPELRDRIARRRSLRGLLELTVELDSLSPADCRILLEGRIAAMQRDGEPRSLFDAGALGIVTGWSGGNAGKLVLLAGECLVEAIARGKDAVDERIAHQVARELTDQAREQARAEAASPYAEPAIQTKIPLLLDDAPVEASPATTPGRAKRGRAR
jgi:type II secretory pathway predicted ATPase ExeA